MLRRPCGGYRAKRADAIAFSTVSTVGMTMPKAPMSVAFWMRALQLVGNADDRRRRRTRACGNHRFDVRDTTSCCAASRTRHSRSAAPPRSRAGSSAADRVAGNLLAVEQLLLRVVIEVGGGVGHARAHRPSLRLRARRRLPGRSCCGACRECGAHHHEQPSSNRHHHALSYPRGYTPLGLPDTLSPAAAVGALRSRGSLARSLAAQFASGAASSPYAPVSARMRGTAAQLALILSPAGGEVSGIGGTLPL